MNVDFFSFSYAPDALKELWLNQFKEVIQGGVFIGGPHVKRFEEAWSNYNSAEYSVGVSNGLDGLIIALMSLNIGIGHRVAVPAHTFIATWTAVLAVGATPVGVDVDEEGLIDLEKFADLADQVDAVIPVHMHGTMVDMTKLLGICTSNQRGERVKVVEDASQAHGVVSRESIKPGQLSDLAVYSLYPTKNLGALGDAGVITTNNEEIFEKLCVLRNYGSSKYDKYFHEVKGFNNRLDPIQASILSANLSLLNEWNQIRRELSSIYIRELTARFPIMQRNREDSVRHHFCILTNKRLELREYLVKNNIRTEIHYPRVAAYEAAKIYGLKNSHYPVAEKIARETLSLPLSQWHNQEQIGYVVRIIMKWN
jgi:dTDP-4-amino-4,6-dideoxygalactose transaminase